MHFSQIGGERGSCFPEMRAYMVSKLMWNPDLDSDSLMRSFMRGYYGAAAPHIYQYEKLLEGGLLASGKELWIYDSPVTHKDGMLNGNCRRRYNELFDLAEAAVADDSVLLDRVRLSRLPLQYSELEIDRAEGVPDPAATAARLALSRSAAVISPFRSSTNGAIRPRSTAASTVSATCLTRRGGPTWRAVPGWCGSRLRRPNTCSWVRRR